MAQTTQPVTVQEFDSGARVLDFGDVDGYGHVQVSIDRNNSVHWASYDGGWEFVIAHRDLFDPRADGADTAWIYTP